MAGFNIADATRASSAEDEGTTFPVLDATGTPMVTSGGAPVTITIAGSYSARFYKAEQAFNARMGKRQRRAGGDMSSIMERRGIELSAACVMSWFGLYLDAAETQPLPCTAENAEKVFTSARWVYDQAWEAMNDHAGFSKPTSAT